MSSEPITDEESAEWGKLARAAIGAGATIQAWTPEIIMRLLGEVERLRNVEAQAADTNQSFDETMNSIWGKLYPAEPTGWEYPGMVIQHVGSVVAELAAERQAREAAEARAAKRAWLLAANDALHLHLSECDWCKSKITATMYWDDGECDKFSALLEVEAAARAALSHPAGAAPVAGAVD